MNIVPTICTIINIIKGGGTFTIQFNTKGLEWWCSWSLKFEREGEVVQKVRAVVDGLMEKMHKHELYTL